MPYDASARFEVQQFDVEVPRAGLGPLLLRIYQPQGAGPFPVLLDIHGGAWSAGDRTRDAYVDLPVAESGVLIVSPEIRMGPRDPYPAQMQDINLATRWARAFAAQVKGDSSVLGGLGWSSGGQSVVLSAMRPRDPRYAALPLEAAADVDASLDYLISCWPVIDPLHRYNWARSVNNQELIDNHDGYFLTEAAMVEASPPHILDAGEDVLVPPLLLIHGTADDNVPMSLIERFAGQWSKAGGEVSVDAYEGGPHSLARAHEEGRLYCENAIKAYLQQRLRSMAGAR